MEDDEFSSCRWSGGRRLNGRSTRHLNTLYEEPADDDLLTVSTGANTPCLDERNINQDFGEVAPTASLTLLLSTSYVSQPQ